jgi:hypothetical protein
MDIEMRATRAQAALDAWYEAGGDEPDLVRDLLADLMHLCDQRDIDFDHEVEMARAFYSDEQEAA